MKILDLGEFYSERGGGVRAYTTALMEAAAARGHEVVLVAPGPRDSNESVGGGRVLRYRAPRMPYDGTYHLPYRLGLMRRWVQEYAPDVLQLSSPYLPWVAARELRGQVRSYIYHSDPIGAYVMPLVERWAPPLRDAAMAAAWGWMRAVCNSCDATVVAGDWLRRELEQQGVERVRSVPFGVAHQKFGRQPRSDGAALWPEASSETSARLLIAGRLAVEKRQALLIHAIAKLNETRKASLLVLGDGPEAPRLKRLAERILPGTRFIPFTRDRDEYARILASADALVHGSRSETYGFVLVEALASGTPLVVPDAGGAAQLADTAAQVSYAAGATSTEIAAAIASLLSRPREATRRAARQAAERHFSREQHFDALFELYEHLIAERASPGSASWL
jgi:alpha-1,6-mannosyltransferase